MITDTPAVHWKLSEHDAGVLLRLLNVEANQADPVWQPYWQQQVARLKAAMEEAGQVVHRRLAAARHPGNGHARQPLPTLAEPAGLECQVAELTRANHDDQAEIARLKAALSSETAQREQAEANLKAETERLRLLFEFAPDAYYVNDLTGKFLAGNRAAEEITGYPRQELVGKNFLETNLLSPEEMAKAAANLPRGARGQATGPDEFTLTRRDGSRVTVEIRTYPVTVAGQTVVLGIARDITERKQIEVTLRESNQRLEIALAELKVAQAHLVQQERLAAVGQIAAGIAHEFNNILTSMLGFAELLQVAPDTPVQMRTDLMHIIRPGRRAAHLVRQLLDFSHKSIRQPQPLDLGCFIPETVEFLHHALAENIQVCLAVDPGLYPVEADPTQLQQMLANLVFNARDAMPGGGTLRIGLTRLEAQAEASCMACHQPITGDWVCLTVLDTGSGIPAEVLSHIFEPFFTTKPVGQGTGLGLPQVLGIVHQHAGHITVSSRAGQGTAFAIYWPPAQQARS